MKKLLIIAAFVVAAPGAHAVGISASPTTLEFKANVRDSKTLELRISNPSDEVALYELYSEEFENYIKLTPVRFILESGESRTVSVRVESKEALSFSTTIAIEASPVGEARAGIGGGVRVPLTASIASGNSLLAGGAPGGAVWAALAALVAIAGFVAFRKRFRIVVRLARQ